MAVTVSIAITSPGGVIADSTLNGVLTISSTELTSISVRDAQIFEMTSMGIVISQPYILTPNAAPGTYNTIGAASTAYYPFQLVVPSPNTPGASPNAPNALHMNAQPAYSYARLGCTVVTNNGTDTIVSSATLNFAVGSAVAPFPVPIGGALQFNTGGDAVNWFFF